MDFHEKGMAPDEIINSNSDNVKESSTNNEQRERSKTVSLARKRRGTQSNGDGSSGSTKQTLTTAINQILNRRASISSQRPKDLLAEINTNRLESTNSTQNTSPPSPVAVNAPFKQQQQHQNQLSHSAQQPQPFQRLLRKKSLHTSTSVQYSPVSPSQASPLSPTVEEDLSDSLSDTDSNNNRRIHHGSNSSSNPSINSIASSVSSPRKQFIFDREQKLLMSSQTTQTKDDKMEKLLKKAKIFLDVKQRPKARIASLWSFIDVTSEFDQAQFFQQNAEEVFDVVYKSFMCQVDKIKQKSDRPSSFTSKEFLNLNKILLLLRKIFLFIPDRIRGGWQKKHIANILSILLDHGNHPRVRIQGFQLLILWLNDQTMELDECIHLYSNAISLDIFFFDQTRSMDEKVHHTKDKIWRKSYIPLALGQELIRGDSRGPLFPNPHQPTFTDAVNLIQIDLGSIVRLAHVAAGSIPPSENYEFPAIESIEPDNGIAIGMGIDAAFASAKFHFELIKKQYLVKLFPQCAKRLGLLPEDQEYGFQKCPPTILRAFVTFFIHHCLDNYGASDTISSYPSPATPILKSIMLAPENREFAHEVVKQSLMLPAGSPLYKDIVRGAVHIVGVWILSGEEERPAFLRKSLQNLPLSSPSTSQSDTSITPNLTPLSATSFASSYSDANIYLRRYIMLLNLVFDDHSFLTVDGGMTNIEVEAQVSIYRDVLSLYRSMTTESSIEIELGTWETLLRSLLDLQKKIMNQNDKYASIPSVALADDLADYLIETLLYAFARSEFQDQDLWNKLAIQMSFSVRWYQTISQWTKIMLRLTKILSKHVYQVDLNQVELQRRLLELSTSGRHHHRRKPSKYRTKQFSLKHKSSGSTSSREDFDLSSPGSSKNFIEHGKVGRRTLSMHSDTNQLDTKLLGVGNHGPAASSLHSGSISSDDDENDDDDDFFDARSDIGNEVKSNRTSAVFFSQPNFSNEKLSMSLANFRSPDFINLDVLSWTAESSLLVWRNMLYALGNLNCIQIVPYHTDAIKCLIDMLDMFELVCHNQFGNVPLPPIYEFVPWFLEACELPLAFAPGRALAYGGLCKIMSHRHHEFNKSYYPNFYRTLMKGLIDSDRTITYAIINNSTKLFSQGLPGINVLYRPFIESIRNLLSEHDSKRIPDSTRQNAITILCSLIRFDMSDSKKCFEERLMLKEALIDSLSTEDSIKNHDMYNMLLYGICTLTFDELTATTWPDKTIIKECFRAMMDHLYWSHLSIVSAAADCLITFAQNFSMWSDNEEIYVMVLQDVFANLIGALDEHITIQKATARNGRGFIIVKLFYCLLEWLMAIPSYIFTDTDLCQLVLDVIDLAFEDRGVESLNYYKKVYPTPLRNRRKETKLRFKKSVRRITLGTNFGSETYVHVGGENDVEDENFVKEVAECILLHLTHHIDNFAPSYGPATMNSTLTGPIGSDTKDDECAEHYQYFSFNDRTIITVVEMPEEISGSRLIIRDMTGRYTWDTKLFYKEHFVPYLKQSSDPNHSEVTKYMTLRPNIKVEPTSSKSKLSNSRIKSRNQTSNLYKDKNKLPVWTENCNYERADMLDNLLYYVSGHTSLSETLLDFPETIIDGFQTEFEKELDRHIQEEILYVNSADSQASSWYQNIMSLRNNMNQVTENKNNKNNRNKISEQLLRNPLYSRSTSYSSLGADFSLSKAFLPVIPPEAEEPQEPYQQCRLFLSHIGWLNPDTFKDGSICMLDKGPALYRDIRLLDKKYSRECIKVALLYVGLGQEDEQSILHNTNGSKEYDEFVTSLGWEIDLATHPGYLGGLERNSTNGTTSIYYCNSTLEIIFHDVTRMPTDPTDLKQLRKKRHIGNDHVHIIWNEHHREYRKYTIGGDFGNVQIIISPLSTNASGQSTDLYNVDIYRDNKIPPFGPLLNGMVVTKNLLGPLVRMTAIHAFRASINTIYQHPYLQRSSDINMIMSKHKKNSKSNNSYESFISKIFFTNDLPI